MKETELVKACLQYLKLKGVMAWRINAGGGIPIVQPGQKRRAIHLAPQGMSDIIGILPGGSFLAIECKIGRNKLSPYQGRFS